MLWDAPAWEYRRLTFFVAHAEGRCRHSFAARPVRLHPSGCLVVVRNYFDIRFPPLDCGHPGLSPCASLEREQALLRRRLLVARIRFQTAWGDQREVVHVLKTGTATFFTHSSWEEMVPRSNTAKLVQRARRACGTMYSSLRRTGSE